MTFKEEILSLSSTYTTPELERIKVLIKEAAIQGLDRVQIESSNSFELLHYQTWFVSQGFETNVICGYKQHKMVIMWRSYK